MWWLLVLSVAVVLAASAFFLRTKAQPTKLSFEPDAVEDDASKKPKSHKHKHKQTVPFKTLNTAVAKPKTDKGHDAHHPLLAATLKGHSDKVTAVAWNGDGKLIATGSEDRTIRIWNIATLPVSGPIRVNLHLDFATALSFSADSAYLFVALADTKRLVVYAVQNNDGKVSLNQVSEFPTMHHEKITHLVCGAGHSWVMTCAEGTETKLRVFSSAGALLAELNTNQISNNMITVSKDRRFVTAATRMGDVKIWEVKYGKAGEFQSISPAMELKGHKRAVQAVAFNNDATRAVSSSLDGYWRLWDISVRYALKEETKLLAEHLSHAENLNQIVIAEHPKHTPLVVFSSGENLHIADAASGKEVETIAEAQSGAIESLLLSPDAKLVLTFGRDKHAHVWRLPL